MTSSSSNYRQRVEREPLMEDAMTLFAQYDEVVRFFVAAHDASDESKSLVCAVVRFESTSVSRWPVAELTSVACALTSDASLLGPFAARQIQRIGAAQHPASVYLGARARLL